MMHTLKSRMHERMPREVVESILAGRVGVGELAFLFSAGLAGMRPVQSGMIWNWVCSGCLLPVPADMLVDCAEVPIELALGEKWACTGCLNGWWRTGRRLNGEVVTRSVIARALGLDPPEHPYWDKVAMSKNRIQNRISHEVP